MNKQIAEKLGREVADIGGDLMWRKTPEHDYTDLPDFTHSLDACVKYIVPWLEEHIHGFYWHYIGNDKKLWAVDLIMKNGNNINVTAESPSLALCKAFTEV